MARILVIDDDDDVREMVKVILARAGHEVVEAINGRDGVRLYKDAPAELVVTDIFMPEQEGLETIMELRTLDPGIKILAMSGGIPAMDRFATLSVAKKLGADRTIPKPVAKAELLAAVMDLLSPD